MARDSKVGHQNSSAKLRETLIESRERKSRERERESSVFYLLSLKGGFVVLKSSKGMTMRPYAMTHLSVMPLSLSTYKYLYFPLLLE